MGSKFNEDLRKFREQNKIFEDICLNGVKLNETVIKLTRKNPDDLKQVCKQMMTQEPDYILYTKYKIKAKLDTIKSNAKEHLSAPEKSWFLGNDLTYKPLFTDGKRN